MNGTEMIKSTFRAFDRNGIVIYRATVTGVTFDEHDARIDTLINKSFQLDAARFEVIGR